MFKVGWAMREKHRLAASHTCPDWGLNCNLGMHPDWESNLQPFGAQDGTSTNSGTGLRQRTIFSPYDGVIGSNPIIS